MRCPRSFRLLVAVVGAALAIESPLAGQVSEGISVGITPTVERVFFDNDLLFSNATYFGGRLGLNFGRHVALQGYYLTVDGIDADSLGSFDSYRAGGDVTLTFTERQFTPFMRFGAGMLAFDGSGPKSELLTATLGAGLRFDLFDRLQTQVFVQDLMFRASDRSDFVDPATMDSLPANRTFHNLTIGAGVNFYVGGRPQMTDTDRFFEQGLRGVSIPLEVFAGEMRFNDDFGLADKTVAGARLGVDFGSYVGLQGYFFGSTENDFTEFNDFYGYGLEGTFNLTKSNTSLTPFLVLGSGRMHFTPGQVQTAGFSDDNQWTATLGAGLAINLDDRVRLKAAARDVLMSRDDPADVLDPNQIRSSWLLTGGLELALGGSNRRADLPGGPAYVPALGDPAPVVDVPAAPPPVEAAPAANESVPAASAAEMPGDTVEVSAAEMPGDTVEASALRARVESLEAELVALREGTGAASPDRMMHIPAPERGELYVRWGEPGAVLRVSPSTVGAAASDTVAADTVAAASVAADSAGVVSAGVVPAAITPPSDARSAEYDALAAALGSIAARLDAMETSQARADSARTAAALADVEARIQDLEASQTPTTIVVPPAEPPSAGEVVIVGDTGARSSVGVFRGGGFELSQIGLHTGVSLSDPTQALIGVRADLGSAFGGSARFVPSATLGVSGDATFNLNAHIEWPLPFDLRGFAPFVGGGIGVLSGRKDSEGNSDVELLIPNLAFGVWRPIDPFELYGAFEALDFFDNNRFILGLRTRPRLRRTTVVPSRPLDPTPAAVDPAGQPQPSAAPDSLTAEQRQEQQRLEAARIRLEAELADVARRIAEQRELGEAEDLAARRSREGEARRRAESDSLARFEEANRDVLVSFRTLAVDVGSVSAVRQGDRGLVVELGGGVFASGQSNLSPEAQSDIEAIARVLVRHPMLNVAIEGHTDSTGSDAANQRMSDQRARAVRRALEAYGVETRRLSTAGFGETRPVVTNSTAEGRARNRRVEIIVLGLRPLAGGQ